MRQRKLSRGTAAKRGEQRERERERERASGVITQYGPACTRMPAYTSRAIPHVRTPLPRTFFDARKRNLPQPTGKTRVCFPLNRVRSNFGKECVSLDTSVYTGIACPDGTGSTNFNFHYTPLPRFRGRISKVCKATDLDFHGNLDALRLAPSTVPALSPLSSSANVRFPFAVNNIIDPRSFPRFRFHSPPFSLSIDDRCDTQEKHKGVGGSKLIRN